MAKRESALDAVSSDLSEQVISAIAEAQDKRLTNAVKLLADKGLREHEINSVFEALFAHSYVLQYAAKALARRFSKEEVESPT